MGVWPGRIPNCPSIDLTINDAWRDDINNTELGFHKSVLVNSANYSCPPSTNNPDALSFFYYFFIRPTVTESSSVNSS